ncbi:protein FAM124B [Nycticebus coucang]|uniref:protein FAM124B n=1 Tax=Nycticebus coucang TaxID=9470 RepID=UPI00234D42B6|nr:protein FAM124B [Nycticebus coucang]
MEETQGPLAMTVHLLANSGHGSLLQRTVDQLLDCICPEVRLFLVSERVRPVKSYDKAQPRRSRCPGVSVLLFLRESFGEERLLRALDSLRRAPWQRYPGRDAQARLRPCLLADQELYSLDSQTPVWGVRQAHRGAEVLRVTLYCGFDNYEDAVRLYEMILQREATLQRSDFCFFVLYATENLVVQLALKQLPLGMSVDPKESSVLQFKVQEIGQLVPLLPNPCVPISSTRWQTQDYDGNKILLQVQLSSGAGVRNEELSLLNGTLGANMLVQGSRLPPVPAKKTPQPRSQRSRARRLQVRSLELPDHSGSPVSVSPNGTLWKSPSWSFQASTSPSSAQPHLPSLHLKSGATKKVFSWENSFQKLEEETNVDTGFTVISSEPRQSFLTIFPRGLQTSQPLPAASLEVDPSKNNRDLKESIYSLSLAGQRAIDTKKAISKCPLHLEVHGEENDEEEFFI